MVETDSNKCKRCGQCMSVCPVYLTTFREDDVARGKLALLERVEAGAMNRSKRFEEILSRCLLCGACAQVCANQVQTSRIMQAGRQRLFELEKSGQAESALLRVVREGRLSAKGLLKGGALLQALACRKIPESSGLYLRFPLSYFTERRTVPPIAWNPFIHAFKSESSVETDGPRIGLFVGCGANYLFPDVARALVGILKRLGATLVVPENQVCCGLPAYVSGDTKTAQKLAKKNIEAFESLELDAILSVCASCGSHLKALPSLFSDEPASRDAASSIAKKHMDAMTFLVNHLGIEKYLKSLRPAKSEERTTLRVAYHDPCHLRIGQGVTDSPRRLLKALPGVELLETAHPGQCCGHGGDFNLSHFSLSMEILNRRVTDLDKVQPDTIVTGCTGCLLQLTEGVSRGGLSGRIEVCHPLVLAEKVIESCLTPTRRRQDPPISQAQHTGAGQ
ncbi:MAG: (Fe-S)-binding protein [Deltaproteobacteria bacterium]|nr:(Fe-S)-binding protein [Deltaproteobacteria bacterium]MBW2171053.1 (Fe-S)-binding protein [Deltaproteobacteria bacterium]